LGIPVEKKEKKTLKKAVSLKYELPKHEAPIVTAKGQGLIAEKIIEIAKKHNIPIKDDPDLVEVLSQLDLNEQIPPAVYQVVAEIFAFIYHLNKRYQEQRHTL
jgi:flagellar biosynthesis protein